MNNWIWSLQPIRLFEFYLALTFALSTIIRVRQYRTILGVVRAVPGRWPRLFELIKSYRSIFLTFGTIFPLVIMLALLLTQMVLRRLVLSEGEAFTFLKLWQTWYVIPVLLVGGSMIALDVILILWVGEINRQDLDEYFDKAEHWLKTWKAPVVRIFTFGFVNPRQMVDKEVRAALIEASAVINRSLWWVSIQAGVRILFGIALWAAYVHVEM